MSGYNRDIDTGFDIAESMKFLADLNVYKKMKMEWGVSQKMAAQALLALTNTETSSVTRRPARQSCVRHSGYAVDSTHQAADVVVNLKLMMLDQCMNCMSEGELSRTRQEGLFHLAILGRMGVGIHHVGQPRPASTSTCLALCRSFVCLGTFS